MQFNPEFTRRFLQSTEADAVRALREGGPLDSILISAHCKQCGAEIQKILRWFYDRDFLCPCGGQFHSEPLQQFIARGTIKHLFATKTPEEIMDILKDRNGDA